ncbi:hypothetical protein PAL_GLEAN10014500 [Pteropus alecto]|uniref:Uncharacterized protein n=1 Tax=Pteropus alecto TaxID=9402 RepID=L5KNL4_PTEAL|nr:hypothetical protein PAL_GLEAN10014500 [Pteropus alecto]
MHLCPPGSCTAFGFRDTCCPLRSSSRPRAQAGGNGWTHRAQGLGAGAWRASGFLEVRGLWLRPGWEQAGSEVDFWPSGGGLFCTSGLCLVITLTASWPPGLAISHSGCRSEPHWGPRH